MTWLSRNIYEQSDKPSFRKGIITPAIQCVSALLSLRQSRKAGKEKTHKKQQKEDVSPACWIGMTSDRRISNRRNNKYLILLLCAAGLLAGSMQRTEFILVNDGIADSNLTVTTNGVGLAIDRYQTIKMFGDSFPVHPLRSSYPDVAVNGIDTFSFFYMDTVASQVRVQGVRLQANGLASSGIPRRAFDCQPVLDCYLHVDQGVNGYLGSFIQEGNGVKRYLQVNNGSRAVKIDSANTTGWLFSSQSVMRGDTFIVINSTDMNRVMLRKIYSRGTTIRIIDSVEVAVGAATQGNSLTNCAVAVDENGVILASYIRGSPNSNKYLYYQFYQPDLTPGPSGSFAQRVSDNEFFYYYDDVPVASYGPGRFAFAAWDGSGVLLHRLRLSGNSVDITSSRVISRPGVHYTTIAANNRFLAVACIGDVDGNGVAALEGLMYTLDDFELGTAETISFSDPTVPVQTVDRFSTALNCAVDDSGTIALTWRNNIRIGGSIWGYRAIRHEKGFYTSPVESLTAITDSIQFDPLQPVLTTTAYWFTEDSLRFGSSPQACRSASWISFSDAAVLRDNRILGCYFQYRVTLNRTFGAVIDSLTTAELTRVNLSWNTRPRLTSIDSVIITTGNVTNVASEDTLTLTSRSDSVHLFMQAYDFDPGSNLAFSLSQPSVPQSVNGVADGSDFSAELTILPLSRSDTTYTCSISVVDEEGWHAAAALLYLETENSVPEMSVAFRHKRETDAGDTIAMENDTALILQVEDTLELYFSVRDSNDAESVRGYFIRSQDGANVVLDSLGQSIEGRLVVIADTAAPTDSIRLFCSVSDPDTTLSRYCGVIINHPPRIRALYSGSDTIDEGDTFSVVLDDTVRFTLAVNDTDCSFGDTLFYRMESPLSEDTLIKNESIAVLMLIPDWGDTLVRFFVRDRFGRNDSIMIYCAYPWYATDSVQNPGYMAARSICRDSFSLIDGSDGNDSVIIPLVNTGRSRLIISGCRMSLPENNWLRIIIGYGTPDSFSVTASDTLFSEPVRVYPDSLIRCMIVVSANELTGDSIQCDAIIFATDDPRHRFDTIPVCLEYNDLPRILSVDPDFIADRPYQPIAKKMAYYFPPHATVAVAFTEPMDSSTAVDGVVIYSRTDAQLRDRIVPIPLEQQWLQNYTVLHLTPRYTEESPSFGVLPPEGLFIPTDSLELVISSSLTDRATTPSGPNELDVNLHYKRDQNADTTIGMRVDSIGFTVLSIEPQPGDTMVGRAVTIRLHFSSSVYAASVDTTLAHNRSLTVRSLYNGGDTLAFSAVVIDSNLVEFTVGRKLFYRDSLMCTYRSRWIRDRLGFASDNNRDGIDATMFDTTSEADDLIWGYRVKPLRVSSVEPDSGVKANDVSPMVTLHFDDTIPAGVVDTDTSLLNASLRIGSSRTGWSSFRRIRIGSDSTSIIFQPRLTFFSNDSVYCEFTGFSGAYRYGRISNYPDSSGDVFGGYQWHFYSGEIGFYTYPNPYKPGVDRRHCEDNGPCGIWFKNLHVLANEINEVSVTIFTMTAHPVFNSLKSGVRIRFGEGAEGNTLPQWFWDTRNNHGQAVVSGLYLYAIYDTKGKVLKRGKLVIVR